VELIEWLGRSPLARRRFLVPALAALVLSLVIVPPPRTAIRFDIASRPDKGRSREWIDKAFPPGTNFAVERFTPVLDPKRYQSLHSVREKEGRLLGSYADNRQRINRRAQHPLKTPPCGAVGA
jgi:hypothetical protein